MQVDTEAIYDHPRRLSSKNSTMSFEEVQVSPNSDEEYPQFKSSQLD